MTALQHRIAWYGSHTIGWSLVYIGRAFGSVGWLELSVPFFRWAAQLGLPHASYKVGETYLRADGVPKDTSKAAKWLQKAADQEYAPAQARFGYLYLMEFGESADIAEALRYLHKAAEQGNAMACRYLGIVYDSLSSPDVLASDDEQAARWYSKASEMGDRIAQTRLARLYLEGRGVPQDYGLAMSWAQRSAAQGEPDAQNLIGTLYEFGYGASQDLRKANTWYTKAALSYPSYLPAWIDLATVHHKARNNVMAYACALTCIKVAETRDDSDDTVDIAREICSQASPNLNYNEIGYGEKLSARFHKHINRKMFLGIVWLYWLILLFFTSIGIIIGFVYSLVEVPAFWLYIGHVFVYILMIVLTKRMISHNHPYLASMLLVFAIHLVMRLYILVAIDIELKRFLTLFLLSAWDLMLLLYQIRAAFYMKMYNKLLAKI